MSGHSKWSTIKHKKAAADAKRGAVFGKLSKKIYLAARRGGVADEERNPYLRQVMEEARLANMPLVNVRRAIDRALGTGKNQVLEEVDYEGYGPGGVGIMVKCVTDNKNRTGGEVRLCLEKYGGNLGEPGSVSYMRKINPPPLIKLGDSLTARIKELLEALEEQEDAVDVWSNLDVS